MPITTIFPIFLLFLVIGQVFAVTTIELTWSKYYKTGDWDIVTEDRWKTDKTPGFCEVRFNSTWFQTYELVRWIEEIHNIKAGTQKVSRTRWLGRVRILFDPTDLSLDVGRCGFRMSMRWTWTFWYWTFYVKIEVFDDDSVVWSKTFTGHEKIKCDFDIPEQGTIHGYCYGYKSGSWKLLKSYSWDFNEHCYIYTMVEKQSTSPRYTQVDYNRDYEYADGV